MKRLVYKLKKDRTLLTEEFYSLLAGYDEETLSCINREAREVSLSRFGNKIYIRGLIEISNCCKNDCYYCGIRKSNRNIERYRLQDDSIVGCCADGYELGFRTFVLQGGEDPAISDDRNRGTYTTTISRLCHNAIFGRKKQRDVPASVRGGSKPLSTEARDLQQGSLSGASPVGDVLRQPYRVSRCAQRNRFPDRDGHYGG